MPSLINTFNKLDSFAKLPNGWRFGKGQPINSIKIEIGKLLLGIGFINGIERFNAFAGDNGELMISFYFQNRNIDLTLEVNNTFTFEEDSDDEQIEFLKNLDYSNAYDKICQFAQSIFESSTQETTTLNEEDSRVFLSSLQQRTKVYQYSIPNVVSPQVAQFASISPNFTTHSQATRPFTGKFQRKTSQKGVIFPKAIVKVGINAITI